MVAEMVVVGYNMFEVAGLVGGLLVVVGSSEGNCLVVVGRSDWSFGLDLV